MADFQDVINTIEKEGDSFRQLLADQKKSGESPAKRDAKATAAIKREEKTNNILKEILKSLGVGGSGGSGGSAESVTSSDGLGLLGLSLGSATFSALIAGIAMLTDTDAAIKAFGLPKTFRNVIGALKLLKNIVLLPFTITGKLIKTISSGVKGFLTLLNKISDFKYTPPKWLNNFGKFLGDLFGKFKTGIVAKWTKAVDLLLSPFKFITDLFSKFKKGISTKWTAGVAKLADAGEFITGLFKSIKTSINGKVTAGVAKLADAGEFVTDLFKSIKTSISTKITKGLKTVFGTLEFGPEFTKTISTAFDTVIKPVKTLLSGADGAGGFLGFFSKIGTFLKPIGGIIKSVGKLAFPIIKTLMRPFLQIILTIFDFIGGAFAGFNESEGKGFVERIKYVVLRGLGGIVTGFTDIIDMIICDVVPWIAKQLGFDEFAKKLGSFGGISRFVTPIFDYIFGMGKNEADGGLPSAIGRLFAEKIPAALATAGAKFTAIGDSIGNMIKETSIFKFIYTVINDIICSVKAIFSGEDIIANLGKLGAGFFDLVMYPFNLAINFLKDIFCWGDPNEPFRLSEFIGDLVKSVVGWFGETFSWENIKSKIGDGLDVVKSIKDTIGCMVSDTVQYFSELFSLDNLKGMLPTLDSVTDSALSLVGMGEGTNDEKTADLQKQIAQLTADNAKFLADPLSKGISDKDNPILMELKSKQLELAKLQEAAKAKLGGITTTQGLVNIHPQEAIIPLEKMDDVINKINTAAINKSGASGAPIVMAPSVVNAPTDARSSTTIHSGNPVPISAPFSYSSILDG